MSSLDRLRRRFDEWRDDPDYLYEGVVLELTEQVARCLADRGIRRSELAERLGTSCLHAAGSTRLTPRRLAKTSPRSGALAKLTFVELPKPRTREQEC